MDLKPKQLRMYNNYGKISFRLFTAKLERPSQVQCSQCKAVCYTSYYVVVRDKALKITHHMLTVKYFTLKCKAAISVALPRHLPLLDSFQSV